MKIQAKSRPAKALVFDIETRTVGFHQAGQWKPKGCEPICIACSWVGEDKVECVHLGTHSMEEMLTWFVMNFYDVADLVIGHHIRGFDLPIINGALLEARLPKLSAKLTQDTLKDHVLIAGRSKSMENLAATYALTQEKRSISDHTWRAAGRLEEWAMREIEERCKGDVLLNKQLRVAMLEAGVLKPPKGWKP